MELHEVCHARRSLAGELEVVLAHPIITPLLVEFGHHRGGGGRHAPTGLPAEVFRSTRKLARRDSDCPAERLGEDARIVVQVGRFGAGQIVDVTDVRRRVVEDRRDGAPNVDR